LIVTFMPLHIVYGCKRFSKHKKIISIVFLGMSGTFETFSSIKYEFLEISNINLTSKI
jgi:fluoride ion exporter CrcB/FEX